MTKQPDLFSITNQEKFDTFHRHNPRVYETLVRLCREWRAAHPTRRCSIELLWNRVRWEMWMVTDNNVDAYKLNNNHKPFYARLIMAREPDLDGIFETREQGTMTI